ncbi:MAG: hypothetical protein H6610_01665 [Ignavibacteriales bacterium]|nr:hypothetical protein [Ignavibacteriales bacterium]
MKELLGWGFYPARGYTNEAQDYIAMSNKADSWPPLGWPSRGFDKKWPGEWNGRFGRGIQYAALECYYAFNDFVKILIYSSSKKEMIQMKV